jgi:hypothetical protein
MWKDTAGWSFRLLPPHDAGLPLFHLCTAAGTSALHCRRVWLSFSMAAFASLSSVSSRCPGKHSAAWSRTHPLDIQHVCSHQARRPKDSLPASSKVKVKTKRNQARWVPEDNFFGRPPRRSWRLPSQGVPALRYLWPFFASFCLLSSATGSISNPSGAADGRLPSKALPALLVGRGVCVRSWPSMESRITWEEGDPHRVWLELKDAVGIGCGFSRVREDR